eukprot:365747-Chlamydomonas_euryale.AAC.33
MRCEIVGTAGSNPRRAVHRHGQPVTCTFWHQNAVSAGGWTCRGHSKRFGCSHCGGGAAQPLVCRFRCAAHKSCARPRRGED